MSSNEPFSTRLEDGKFITATGKEFTPGDQIELTAEERQYLVQMATHVHALGAVRTRVGIRTSINSEDISRDNQNDLLTVERLQLQIPVSRTRLIHMLAERLGGFLPLGFDMYDVSVTVSPATELTDVSNEQIYQSTGGQHTVGPILVAIGDTTETLEPSSAVNRVSSIEIDLISDSSLVTGAVWTDVENSTSVNYALDAIKRVVASEFGDQFHLAFLNSPDRGLTEAMNLVAQVTDQPYPVMWKESGATNGFVISSTMKGQVSLSLFNASGFHVSQSWSYEEVDSEVILSVQEGPTDAHPTVPMFLASEQAVPAGAL